jgi:transposase
MQALTIIEGKYRALVDRFDEATLRQWAAVEARTLGRGGVSVVAKALGMSRTTIYAGLKELKAESVGKLVQPSGVDGVAIRRVRANGGGRKRLTEKDATILRDLEALVEPSAKECPLPPLFWTCKSTSQLARELVEQGHSVSQRSVCAILAQLGYSLQSTRKTQKIGWDGQFHHIADVVAQCQAVGDPVIFVDTKKALVGDVENGGGKWRVKRNPGYVRVKDFLDGNYEGSFNRAWISVSVDHDNAEFVVEGIRRWWKDMAHPLYPRANRMLIAANCGSSGYRLRLWQVQLQKLADELQLIIQVCHFPPGTRRWNRIEHRMVYQVTHNWRGRSPIGRQVVVNLIGDARAGSGLPVRSQLDEGSNRSNLKVSEKQFAQVMIERDRIYREWNYRFLPRYCSPGYSQV